LSADVHRAFDSRKVGWRNNIRTPLSASNRRTGAVRFPQANPSLGSSSPAVVRAILGGWQLGSIITQQTGFASGLARVVDTTGTGIAPRVNMVAGQDPMLPPDQRTRERWFNTAAFSLPVAGQFGNAVRHPIHLPGLNQVDASAVKTSAYSKRTRSSSALSS
jgi:hypothetical protein